MNSSYSQARNLDEIREFFVPGRMFSLKVGIALGPPYCPTALLERGESIFILSSPKVDNNVVSCRILTAKGIFVFSLHETWKFPECLERRV